MRVLRVPDEPSPPVPERELREVEEEPEAESAPPFPLVLVTWRDAWFDADQQDTKDWRADYLVHTVGYLVREEKGIVSIASEVLPQGDGFRAVTHIPKAIIKSVTTLVPVDPDGQAADLTA